MKEGLVGKKICVLFFLRRRHALCLMPYFAVGIHPSMPIWAHANITLQHLECGPQLVMPSAMAQGRDTCPGTTCQAYTLMCHTPPCTWI